VYGVAGYRREHGPLGTRDGGLTDGRAVVGHVGVRPKNSKIERGSHLRGNTDQRILDSRAGRGIPKLDEDEDRQPTKTESRGQYRRREDQYLCMEIQPE